MPTRAEGELLPAGDDTPPPIASADRVVVAELPLLLMGKCVQIGWVHPPLPLPWILWCGRWGAVEGHLWFWFARLGIEDAGVIPNHTYATI